MKKEAVVFLSALLIASQVAWGAGLGGGGAAGAGGAASSAQNAGRSRAPAPSNNPPAAELGASEISAEHTGPIPADKFRFSLTVPVEIQSGVPRAPMLLQCGLYNYNFLEHISASRSDRQRALDAGLNTYALSEVRFNLDALGNHKGRYKIDLDADYDKAVPPNGNAELNDRVKFYHCTLTYNVDAATRQGPAYSFRPGSPARPQTVGAL